MSNGIVQDVSRLRNYVREGFDGYASNDLPMRNLGKVFGTEPIANKNNSAVQVETKATVFSFHHSGLHDS